jgi:hypothetical protein
MSGATHRARWLALVVALAPVAASAQPAAPAAETDATRRGRERFVEGAALAREGRWRDALAAFQESATLRPHAVATYNIAYCERALGHTTRAWRLFGRAIAEDDAAGKVELGDALRRGAVDYTAEAERELGHVIVTLDPPDALVAVDGGPLELVNGGERPLLVAGTRGDGAAESPPRPTFELLIDPGVHSFLVKSGEKSRSIEATVQRGTTLQLTVSIEPPLPAPPPAPAAEPLPAEPHGLAPQRVGALLLGGMGVGAIAVGAALGGVAAQRWSEAQDACPALDACPDDEGHDLSEQAERFGNFATVGLVAGGLALAGGVVLWFTTPSADDETGWRLRWGVASIEVARSW